MDYATFCADRMSEFECHCGTALCRGMITAKDYLKPFVGERYGEHVSGFVATKRAAASKPSAAAAKTSSEDPLSKVYLFGAATVAAVSAGLWFALKR